MDTTRIGDQLLNLWATIGGAVNDLANAAGPIYAYQRDTTYCRFGAWSLEGSRKAAIEAKKAAERVIEQANAALAAIDAEGDPVPVSPAPRADTLAFLHGTPPRLVPRVPGTAPAGSGPEAA